MSIVPLIFQRSERPNSSAGFGTGAQEFLDEQNVFAWLPGGHRAGPSPPLDEFQRFNLAKVMVTQQALFVKCLTFDQEQSQGYNTSIRGSSAMVAHRPSKPFVAGSNPVSRFPRFVAMPYGGPAIGTKKRVPDESGTLGGLPIHKVSRAGFEPATPCLKGRCSAN